jgi:serine phosphatase RsbU (regulator of sigma subunit)/anti-sigma regulatory factor (Ser/Thr protein kinase)
MASIKEIWHSITGKNEQEAPVEEIQAAEPISQAAMLDLDIAPNDPLLIYSQQNPGVVDVDKLLIDSPAVRALRDAGVQMAIPLVSQGELIGLINLGTRLSEQDYSADDRKLLADLATQAAPAVRVAQLARQQQAEAAERERLAQELKVARLIQQTLLPKDVPALTDYEVAAYYQPAREVGGDFYDFIYFEDGRTGLIIGDVTDKGVPAALVMATTRTLLRAAAERLASPGQVLERVNDLLYPDIPARMFVTCLYAVLEPATGRLQYANAGHDLPYRRMEDGVDELHARGMPLGLMPGMTYEEKELILAPGETVLFHSDGLVEAHDPEREMFGFPRLQELMAGQPGGAALIDYLLQQLADFTGPDWEQEDDVTLVTLQRLTGKPRTGHSNGRTSEEAPIWQHVAEFTVASEEGNERQVMEDVANVVQGLEFSQEMALSPDRMEKLKTAVGEATMNAMEHGNKYQADEPVHIEVLQGQAAVAVRITDQGGGQGNENDGQDQDGPNLEMPDLEAKLAGLQSPRGWGLFLIQNMVDEMNVSEDGSSHTIELILNLEEENKPENLREV